MMRSTMVDSRWRFIFFSLLVPTLLVLSVASCGKTDPSGSFSIDDAAIIDSITPLFNHENPTGLDQGTATHPLQRAHALIQQIDSDTLRKFQLKELRKAYFERGDLDAYRSINDEVLAEAMALNDSLDMATCYFNLGVYFYRNEQIDSAYNNYYRSERIYNDIEDAEGTGKALLSMAILQKNVRDYIGSEASTVRSLAYFEELNDTRYLASANNNLGIISTELEKYDEAITYHNKALDYRRKLGNRRLEVGSLNNLGLVYQNKGDFEQALDYYEQALSQDSILAQNLKTKARVMDNWAYSRFLSGAKDGLPGELLGPMALRDSIGDNSGLVTSNLHLAEYYFSIDSLKQARHYAKDALDRSIPLDYNRGMLESLQWLVETSDDAEALAYSKTYGRISDSLYKQERAYQDQFARIRYETETLELEREKATRQSKQLTILSLSLAVLLLLVYIFIQRKSAQKELQYQEIQQQANEEIYHLMLSQRTKLEEGKQFEKQRISEELHDGVLGRLFGARLSLDSYNSNTTEAGAETRAKYIEELKEIEQEIRQISHDLSADIVKADTFYIDGVKQLVENQSELNRWEFRFNNDQQINWEDARNQVKVNVYRIIQESLQNIRKHAEATEIGVSFSKNGEGIQLRIEDNGRGMVPGKVKKGIGLKNIHSRVQQIGGKLKIDSQRGKGTAIRVKFNL